MPEELTALLETLTDTSVQHHGPFTLHIGRLENQPVMLAQCGIGKVNAAALTQLMIIEGASKIIFTGVAGATRDDLNVGDIVVSSDALQHDLDVSALGYVAGEVPGESLAWQADAALQQAAHDAATTLSDVKTVSGRVVSGDQFIASTEKVRWLRDTFDASCAEMEGASVAQVCAKWRIPFVIIRSISDTADHNANINFREFTPLAANRAKQLVRGMLQKL